MVPDEAPELMRSGGSAAAARQHRVQHVVTPDKMVEQGCGRMQSDQCQTHIGDDLMRHHGLFCQHLVRADHRRQLAEKVEIDAPPPRIDVQKTEGGLEQQQDIKNIFGGPRHEFLKNGSSAGSGGI